MSLLLAILFAPIALVAGILLLYAVIWIVAKIIEGIINEIS